MDLDPDEIDIQLRPPIEVGRRMVALAALAYRAAGEDRNSEDDEDLDPDEIVDDVEDRLDWLAWLAAHDLLDALTRTEEELLGTADADLPDDALEHASTAAESLGALAWAVGRSELTVVDRGYPYLKLLRLVPSPWDDPGPFLAGLALRTEDQIAAARDAAELLAWRAVVEVERRRASGRDLADIEAAIRDVATEAVASGVMEVGKKGDLMVAGESIRSLQGSILESMVAASQGRLRAMNWLCGLGNWDDPALTEI